MRYRLALVAAFFVAATALLADFFAVFTTESKPLDPRPSLTRLLDCGLQLRIAPDGKRTLLVRYTVKGSSTERQYRLPQEYGDAPGQIKLAAACAEAGRIRTLARQGVDWTVAEDTRLEAEALTRAAALQRHAGPTFEAELRDYVEKKRRVKDGLALKERTKSDYLAAIGRLG